MDVRLLQLSFGQRHRVRPGQLQGPIRAAERLLGSEHVGRLGPGDELPPVGDGEVGAVEPPVELRPFVGEVTEEPAPISHDAGHPVPEPTLGCERRPSVF